MRRKPYVKIKDGKVKFLDLDGHLIDIIKPMDLDDFTEFLVLKYNRKKRKK